MKTRTWVVIWVLCGLLGAGIAVADKRINEFPAAGAITNATVVPVWQSGTTGQSTVGDIRAPLSTTGHAHSTLSTTGHAHADYLTSSSWLAPGPIGTTTANTGRFTALTVTSTFTAPAFTASGADGTHGLSIYNTTTYTGVSTTGAWRDSSAGPERYDGTLWAPLSRHVLAAPSTWADGQWDGRAITVNVSQNVGTGAVLYQVSPGTWAPYSTIHTSRMAVAMALNAIGTSAAGTALLDGAVVKRTSLALGTTATHWYASTTAGAISATAPVTTGSAILYIGENLGNDVFHFRPGRAWGAK
jgi:hypothetical protein